jgi:hypothetical protein
MTLTPALYGLPLFARRTDPATSHDAAASMEESASAQRQAILDELESLGEKGATNDEMDVLLGWRTGTTSRRMVELIRIGLVVRTSLKRDTASGRGAFVHQLAFIE